MKDKKIIYDILTDTTLSIDYKFQKVIDNFPDYLSNPKLKRIVFEKIEGFFHDALGTYFEMLIYAGLTHLHQLDLELIDQSVILDRLENAQNLYLKFFPENEYKLNYETEKNNIESGSKDAISFINSYIGDEHIINVTHSSSDFVNGNARDIFITLASGEELNFSLKTDKSGRVAISDGQTPKIFEKVYNKYFNLSASDYTDLKKQIFHTVDEGVIFQDYQNVALLTQHVFIKQFTLTDVEINNFTDAKITNLHTLRYFINQLKKHKNGNDKAVVILVNRLTGAIGFESILDSIQEIKQEDFSFTRCKPRKSYKYCATLSMKYKGKTFITFQSKPKRAKKPSIAFNDMTIRINKK